MEIPLIILAGSDRRPGVLPPAGRDKHPLMGYKGVDIRIAGRPLLAHLLERVRVLPQLRPILVAGPRRVYRDVVEGAEVIDTDATVSRNLGVALRVARARFPGRPLGVAACDILPDPGELRGILADYMAGPGCAAWFPLIRAPRDAAALRAFGWKPSYAIVPGAGARAIRVLPGHLGIVDPASLRIPLILRLMEVAYRTRNRPIDARRRRMLRHVLRGLLAQDLRGLARLRPPNLTWIVVWNGLRVARRLEGGGILRADLEAALTAVVVKRRVRRRRPAPGVRLPVLDGLSLACDLDTEEEARQISATYPGRERDRDREPDREP